MFEEIKTNIASVTLTVDVGSGHGFKILLRNPLKRNHLFPLPKEMKGQEIIIDRDSTTMNRFSTKI